MPEDSTRKLTDALRALIENYQAATGAKVDTVRVRWLHDRGPSDVLDVEVEMKN